MEKMKIFSRLLLLLTLTALPTRLCAAELQAAINPGDPTIAAGTSIPSIPMGRIEPELAAIGYSDGEVLNYDVSWSGGIKIGEIHLQLSRLEGKSDRHEIRAEVSTEHGAIDFIYPIRDLHITRLGGKNKLPYYAEIRQKEGYSYEAHREMTFKQKAGEVRYQKNGKLEGVFKIDGETNNEFTSFFNSRLMPFAEGARFIVPTFADKKRVEVVVNVMGRQNLEHTLFGEVATMKIMPVMTFKGLYEKQGDTVIWYTDDECRVPVKIESKIVIGSLTAELTSYENSACQRYSQSALLENN